LVGRRQYIEDHHAIVFADAYKYFGVFDGHKGNRAAKFVSKTLHKTFAFFLDALASNASAGVRASNDEVHITTLEAINGPQEWAELKDKLIPFSKPSRISNDLTSDVAVEAIHRAFTFTNDRFKDSTGEEEKSGTTATVVALFESHLLVRYILPY
jgi:serine/threonine protein phosphatase PrpC